MRGPTTALALRDPTLGLRSDACVAFTGIAPLAAKVRLINQWLVPSRALGLRGG